MRFIKVLFIFCLLFLITGELIRFPIGNNIVVKPLDVFVGIISLSSSIYLFITKKKFKYSLMRPLLIFSIIAVFSLGINSYTYTIHELLPSILYLLRFVMYASIFWIVKNFDTDFKSIISKALIGVGTGFLILGLTQYFYYPDLRNLYYLGWDEHLYRLFSTFLDPNFAGAFLVLSLTLLTGFIFAQKKINGTYHVLVSLAVLHVVGILLTYSRSALLMLLCTVITICILKKKYLPLGVFVVLFVIYLFGASLFFKTENTNLFRSASSLARVESAREAITVWQSNPIIGVGFNTYRYAQRKLGVESIPTNFENHANATTDVSLLFVLATTGVVGFAAYLYLLYSVLRFTYIRSQKNIYAFVGFVSVVGLLVNSLFINSLFYPFILLWMWTLLGLIDE